MSSRIFKKAQYTFPALLWSTLILAILTVLSLLFIFLYTQPVSSSALTGSQLTGKWLLIDSARSINPQTNQSLSVYLDQGMSANDIASLDPIRIILGEHKIKCSQIQKRMPNSGLALIEFGKGQCSSENSFEFKGFVLLPSSFIQVESK